MAIYDKHFFEKYKTGSAWSAAVVVPLIMERFNPKSVVDVGCGIGIWLKEFADNGVQDYLGIDSHLEDESLVIPGVNYMVENLNGYFINEDYPFFDVAISLEVAEHLDPESAVRFVDQLTQLSDHVVFSAAIPQQGGRHHVNEQWQSTWVKLFADFGFQCDDFIRPKIWGSDRVEWWYAQNILTFSRVDGEVDNGDIRRFDLVHPRHYEYKIKEKK